MKKILPIVILLITSCSNTGSFDFFDVVNIPTGDGAGTALSGSFSAIIDVKSNNCNATDLNTPAKGTKVPLDIEVEQKDGEITFDKIDVKLRGAVSFKSEFHAGGAAIVDRGSANNNILQMVQVTGKFDSKDELSGSGDERLQGDLNDQKIDCTYTFGISAVRKP